MLLQRIKFLNTYIDKISIDNVKEYIFQAIDNKKKIHIVYLNALKIYEIDKNPLMKKAISEAELILADGVPIVWVSKLFKNPLPGRVNGTDLFELLLSECESRNKSVYFLGSKEDILIKMLDVIKIKYPKLSIAGHRNGYFSDKDDNDIINDINKSNADILFIGISSPKKELWANKYKNKINVPIIKGVGGSFDVLAGVVSRAPVWMQKYGLEWLYRVIMEPKRMLKRYLITNFYFIYITIKFFIIKKHI
jgi:N-acetylglucosaminyldiphosphoundecaprenol N-acetyl-beta-D-mannosaminyltransferase